MRSVASFLMSSSMSGSARSLSDLARQVPYAKRQNKIESEKDEENTTLCALMVHSRAVLPLSILSDLGVRQDAKRAIAHQPLVTRVPTFSPRTMRTSSPGVAMLKTRNGRLLSRHITIAVASITLRRS